MQATLERPGAAGANVPPGVGAEVVAPGIVKAPGIGEAMRDDHSILHRIEHSGVAIAALRPSFVKRKLRPLFGGEIKGPDIAEEAAPLAPEHHQPPPLGVKQ